MFARAMRLTFVVMTASVLVVALTTSASKRSETNVPRNLRPYFVSFLIKQPSSGDLPKEILAEHLAYTRRQVEAKKYVLVGPIMDDSRIAGMAIIDTTTLAEASAIASADPAVKAGLRTVEVRPAMYAKIVSNTRF